MRLDKIKSQLLGACCAASLLICFSSCYSIRIAVKDGVPEPAFPVTEEGYWRDKAMHTVDTTVRLGALDNEVMYLNTCREGLHTVEYRVTLGHVLLSGITLGKVRKIKMKYACLKEQQ